jgi:hypothetical protein
VTFDTDGGTPSDIEPVTVEDGAHIENFPSDPTKAWHTFLGWHEVIENVMDQETFNPVAIILSDVDLIAAWEEVVPTDSNTKQEIMDYLDYKGITYDSSNTKAQLLALLEAE